GGGGCVGRWCFSRRGAGAGWGLRFARDEADEYWLGASTLNFIAPEVGFALFPGVIPVATWPTPPWTTIIWIGVIQMCLTPILFYPFSKAVWLAIDLFFRPAGPADFR